MCNCNKQASNRSKAVYQEAMTIGAAYLADKPKTRENIQEAMRLMKEYKEQERLGKKTHKEDE